MHQFSPHYYATLLNEQIILEAIGDQGHLRDLSEFYKMTLAPMAKQNVPAEQVYDVIVNEMAKHNGKGISPKNFQKFMNELNNIKRSWDADPQKRGMYKSPAEEMISYLGYWLTSGMVGSAKKYDAKPDITRKEWAETPSGPGNATGAPVAANTRRTFGEGVDLALSVLDGEIITENNTEAQQDEVIEESHDDPDDMDEDDDDCDEE